MMSIPIGKRTIYIGDLKPMEKLTVTLHVKGLKVLMVRLWLGKKLLKLAAKVIGCGFRIDDKEPI
jgi:hypothetical protein